jgi:hypothetical protein
MFDGKTLLFFTPARLGKTYLARQVLGVLSDTALYIDGKGFTEDNQAALRDEVQSEVDNLIRRHGCAQIIFDSYERALQRSQGGRLQSWLNNLLVDGTNARDIGALFTARSGAPIIKTGAGSPFTSRAVEVDSPQLPDRAEYASIRSWLGDSVLLAQQAGDLENFTPTSTVDRLRRDLSYLHDVRQAAGVSLAANIFDGDELTYVQRSAHQGLTTEGGQTRLYAALESDIHESPSSSPVWPASSVAAERKFASMLAGSTQAIWSDRFMYRDAIPLRAFAAKAIASTGCKIRLLGKPEVSDRRVSRAEMGVLNSLPGLEARWMHEADITALHDRHLALDTGGWVLPQVHVIIGKQHPGSAVVAPTSEFGVDYEQVWRRAIAP